MLQQRHSERTEEIVVAFGAGWRREALGEAGWEGRWRRALDWVIRRVHGWMLAATKWLYGIPLQGFAYTVPFALWKEEGLEEEIAHNLWQGTCGCRLVFYPELKHKRDVRRAQERASRCERTHRLDAWSPREMPLWDFIARAVKGDRRNRKQRGTKVFALVAFSYSMFFRHLREDHAVRCGNVLHWCCPHHPDYPFEVPECRRCKDYTVFDEIRHHRRVQMCLLVAVPTGRYESIRFWHCQQKTCENYYRHDLPVCPVCQHRRGRGAAPTVVWVLGPRRITPRAQDEGWEERDLRASVSLTGASAGTAGAMGMEDKLSVKKIIATLPPDLHEIVEMVQKNNTVEDIAHELQCPLEEIHEALEQLRELFNDFDPNAC